MNIPPNQIAELQLLAARAEASIDESFANVRYTSVRNVCLALGDAPPSGLIGKPFGMFAISTIKAGTPFGLGIKKDIMFCRTPEIAKFIVALLNFGGAIVAEFDGPNPGFPRCPHCKKRHVAETFQLGEELGVTATTCPDVPEGMLVMHGAAGTSARLVPSLGPIPWIKLT